MTRSPSQAVAWARNVTRWSPPGYCLIFSRSAFGIGSRYGSAALAWRNAVHKHPCGPEDAPAGVPVFWLGGSRGYGHIAVSLGNGLCRSTDWPRSGQVSTARIADISRAWGQHFQGWTEDLNGVTIPGAADLGKPKKKPTKKRPVLDASNIARAAKAGDKVPNGTLLKKAVAAEVGKGDMNLSTSVLGSGFKKQFVLVQKKFLQKGATGKTADGVPGPASLTWLGKRHGFDVRA